MRVAVDIGGTFTDFVGLTKKGNLTAMKKLTTTKNPSRAVSNGIEKIQRKKEPIEVIVHATTLATNTFLGQEGLRRAQSAMVTTKGFRDVLEIGRQRRSKLYDLSFEKPSPLLPRCLRFEVKERINEEGEMITPLQGERLEKISEQMDEIESIAVCFLHSYENPIHEEKAAEILKKELEDIFITCSHNVCPEYREYERFSTAAVNAVLQPQMWRYLQKISRSIANIALKSPPLYIMNNEGGLLGKKEAVKFPVKLVESGPAAGVIGSNYLAEQLNEEQVITFDMGGTTAKVGAIVGSPHITTEYEIGGEVHRGRNIKGSGYPIRLPFIDLVEVSAGGGTKIWVDETNRLRVGPVSAGSEPGPACYGLGGKEPTLTDASTLLQRLGGKLGGGAVTLDRKLAEKALKEKASLIDRHPIETAYAALRIGNSKMGKAIRIVTVERGFDPREFTLVAFGGMGPMVAPFLAEELNIQKVVIPPYPGVFSSLGLLLSDFKRTFTTSVLKKLNELTIRKLKKEKKNLEKRALTWLHKNNFQESRISFRRIADMRYPQQSWEIMVPLPREIDSLEEITARFNEEYRRKYGYTHEGTPEIVNLRVTALGSTRKPNITFWKEKTTEPETSRKVYFGEEWISTPIYSFEALGVDSKITGPAIFEGISTTVVVPPRWSVQVRPTSLIEKKRE